MLGAGDATKQDTFKRIVCPNDSSKTLGEGPKETSTAITTIAEEAVAEIKGIRVEMR